MEVDHVVVVATYRTACNSDLVNFVLTRCGMQNVFAFCLWWLAKVQEINFNFCWSRTFYHHPKAMRMNAKCCWYVEKYFMEWKKKLLAFLFSLCRVVVGCNSWNIKKIFTVSADHKHASRCRSICNFTSKIKELNNDFGINSSATIPIYY